MTRVTIIAIAAIASSAATALLALYGQAMLASVGLGAAFSLTNEALFLLAVRILSPRRLSAWPRVVVLAIPVGWVAKQGILLLAAFLAFTLTDLPILPFALSVLVFQLAHVGYMIVQPKAYARLLVERQAPITT